MRTGMSLVEVLVSLVLIAITIVFAFETITNSLNLVSRQELEIKTMSLLNFTQSYLAEYRIGVQLPDNLSETINALFHGSGGNVFPRIRTLQATTTSLNVSGSTIFYRIVQVEIRKAPNSSENFVLFFGL
ncbi:MAG: prepilin-type N-terminal cleavage/methylation domain-containing protein [Pseudothermotoga sp.]